MPYFNEAFRYLKAITHDDVNYNYQPEYGLAEFLAKLGIDTACDTVRGPFRVDEGKEVEHDINYFDNAYVNFMKNK